MTYLLDTNAWSAVLKETSPPLSHRVAAMEPSRLLMSAVVWYELQYGLALAPSGKKERLKAKFAAILEDVPVAPFDAEAAEATARVRAALQRTGKLIGPYDLQIAGHALALNATLVTNNTREFERINGLTLEDWTLRGSR